jgi:hypothetical protein
VHGNISCRDFGPQLAWGNDLGRCRSDACGANGAARTSVPRVEAEERASETINEASGGGQYTQGNSTGFLVIERVVAVRGKPCRSRGGRL